MNVPTGISSTPPKRATYVALAVAVLVLLALLVGAYMYQRSKAAEHPGEAAAAAKAKFHGWRAVHYDDYPYNGQRYLCGAQIPACNCAGCTLAAYRHEFLPHGAHPPRGHSRTCDCAMCVAASRHTEHLNSDLQNWPDAGTFGAPGDTFPYGNLYDSQQMTYPTMSDGDGHYMASHGRDPNKYVKLGLEPREKFGGDDQNWPQAGSFGAYADTFPYGNYADGEQMFYPTFFEQDDSFYYSSR